MGWALSNFLRLQYPRGVEVEGVKDLFILAQEGQCKQMVFDGISGVISKTLVNWKMIHYIPGTFGGFSFWGRRGRAPGGREGSTLLERTPVWEQPHPAQRIGQKIVSCALGAPLFSREHRTKNSPCDLSEPLFSPFLPFLSFSRGGVFSLPSLGPNPFHSQAFRGLFFDNKLYWASCLGRSENS